MTFPDAVSQVPPVWPAPAKINLLLRITGRRADGYHELQTVFQLLDFGDEITIESNESGEIHLATPTSGVDEKDDLIVRAANSLTQATGASLGADISVNKRLPLGGGLGGGSSNAATVLYALNILWNTGLDVDSLANLGLQLGADVPVFVRGSSAWAEGVGENLTEIQLPERWFLLLLPGVHVSTAEVFSDPALTRHCRPITIRAFLDERIDCAVENVFQDVVFSRFPEVGAAFEWLSARADSEVVGMSGTGSSVFAAFDDQASANRVLEQIPAPWTGFVAKGVNQSPLHTVANAV